MIEKKLSFKERVYLFFSISFIEVGVCLIPFIATPVFQKIVGYKVKVEDYACDYILMAFSITTNVLFLVSEIYNIPRYKRRNYKFFLIVILIFSWSIYLALTIANSPKPDGSNIIYPVVVFILWGFFVGTIFLSVDLKVDYIFKKLKDDEQVIKEQEMNSNKNKLNQIQEIITQSELLNKRTIDIKRIKSILKEDK